MIEYFTFYDEDGTPYNFEVHSAGTIFKPIAGVYMFTKRWVDQQGVTWHRPIYIGETQSFKDRPLDSGHPKWASAVRLGFNCVCVYPTIMNRRDIQDALVDKFSPSLNL